MGGDRNTIEDISFPCEKNFCFKFKTSSQLRPQHSYKCLILEVLIRNDVWVFSREYIEDEIVKVHSYYRYMDKISLKKSIERCLKDHSCFKMTNNYFKYVGKIDHKYAKVKEQRLVRSDLNQQEGHIFLKYISLIKRTLETSPTKAASTHEIHKNLSRTSRFCISSSTIECVLNNMGEQFFTKVILTDSLELWTLKSSSSLQEISLKVLSRYIKLIKTILKMSETGAGTIDEIQKTLFSQYNYEMNSKNLEIVLEKFGESYFQKSSLAGLVFWENIEEY